MKIRWVAAVACLCCWTGCSTFVPPDYVRTVKTGGTIEAAYLKPGPCKVKSYRTPATDPKLGLHIVYYPADRMHAGKRVPAVVFSNGSGVTAVKYPALFEHLASWGFVVVGNNAESAGNGDSSDQAMAFLLAENDNGRSPLFHRIDLEHLGISGHSQGGAGVFCAVTDPKYGSRYRAAVALSPAHEELAAALKWTYDLTAVHVPTLLLAGTVGDFETKLVIPPEKLRAMYDKLDCIKVMARRQESEHGQMLYSADGYVTAWFMWLLQNDHTAGLAFTGPKAEILTNPRYQDAQAKMK